VIEENFMYPLTLTPPPRGRGDKRRRYLVYGLKGNANPSKGEGISGKKLFSRIDNYILITG
jgi:hypothetical protein